MKPMFVIVVSGGSYDDAWSRAEFVTDDEDKGRAYCEKMNALSEAVKEATVQYGNWQQQYIQENPRVGPLPCVLLPVPQWSGYIGITEEMRNERKRIQDLNQAALTASNQPIYDHSRAMYEAQVAYKATLPEDIQIGMQNSYYDTFWEIEAINWLE